MSTTLQPWELKRPYTARSIRGCDNATFTSDDGELSSAELDAHLDLLESARTRGDQGLVAQMLLQMRIDEARALKTTMLESGADSVRYLSDELMALLRNRLDLRRRAVDLLAEDDPGSRGIIDQWVIDQGRARYVALTSNPMLMPSASTALREINELASILGLV